MAVESNTINVIIKAQDKASAAFSKAGGGLAKLTKVVDKHKDALKKVGVAGAVMLGSLVAMTVGARDQLKTQAVLANAIEKTGESAESVAPKAEAMMSRLQALTGVSDELQRTALAKLTTGLGSAEKAMQALPSVMDAAALSGKDLGSTTDALVKALAGQSQTVRGTAIQFDKAADFGERLAIIQEQMGGAAEAAADPFDKMQATLADVSDAIGVALMPAFNAVADAVAGLATSFVEADPWVHTLLASLGALAGVLAGAAGFLVFLPAITTAVTALGVAFTVLTGPVGWVAAGVAGLVWLFSDTGDAAEDAAPQVEKLGEALGEEIGEGADDAIEALGEVEDAVISAGEIMDGLGKSTGELSKAFKQKFGEMPQAAQDAFALIEAQVAETSGSNRELFSDGIMGTMDQIRNAYGGEIPEHLRDASNAIAKAWKDGPQATFETGVDEVDKTFASLSDSTIKHGTAMQDAFVSVGEAMPAPLRGAVNELSNLLEGGYNEVYLGYINSVLGTMKSLGQNGLLGSQIGVLDNLPDAFPAIDLPQFRRGTVGAAGGPSVLNEAGGEILNLPAGAGVMDAGSSTRLVEAIKHAGRGGGRPFTNLGTINVVADSPDRFLDELELLS